MATLSLGNVAPLGKRAGRDPARRNRRRQRTVPQRRRARGRGRGLALHPRLRALPQCRVPPRLQPSPAPSLHRPFIDFADGSRQGTAWAQATYANARARGARHAHAVRFLARAWIRVLWRCWIDHTPDDPARHLALVQQLGTSETAPQAS